jgi:hypothetical protein
MSDGDSAEGGGFPLGFPPNRRNERNGNVSSSNAHPFLSAKVTMSVFPNRFTGTSKAASSFPLQRPAEVSVKVEEPSFGIIATKLENQVGGDLEYRFLLGRAFLYRTWKEI